jgi:hypothetical protein
MTPLIKNNGPPHITENDMIEILKDRHSQDKEGCGLCSYTLSKMLFLQRWRFRYCTLHKDMQAKGKADKRMAAGLTLN